MGSETFGLHELILCVSEGLLSELLCVHIVGIGTFGPHGLILCVSESFYSELFCVHNVDIESFGLHGLALHDAFKKNPLLHSCL